MSEECIICGESGGLFLIIKGERFGPFCSQHRFDCQVDVHALMFDYGIEQAKIWIKEKGTESE